MKRQSSNRILIVDSEPLVLRVYASQLTRQFGVVTAETAEEAIEQCKCAGPFAVIVSDMNLPGMGGAHLLAYMRENYPETVRIMLTANSRQEVLAQAVNDGGIFRFLNKPCTSERLAKTIELAIERYHRALIERQFLTGAVNASIQIQLDVLEMLNPEALQKSRRVEKVVRFLVDQFSPPHGWMVNLAARLSLIGEAIPPERSGGLTAPEIGAKLFGRLTQLADIVDLIRKQRDEPTPGQSDIAGQRIMRVALAYQDLIATGSDPVVAMADLCGRQIPGDERILDALAQYVYQESGTTEINQTQVEQLLIGT